MDFDALVAEIGAERYAAACEWAWRTAAGTGRRRDGGERWPGDLAEVPHDLHDEWHGLDVHLRVLAEMPCYATTIPLRETPPADRDRLWAGLRAALEDPDDRVADPVSYALWCDWFEDHGTVHEAWAAMVAPPDDDRRLRRVLGVSGPVPWPLKAPLLERLAADPAWQVAVGGALDAAEHDAYGQTDRDAAEALRTRLR